MARKDRLACADNTRKKIKTGMLIKKLTDHVVDGVEMSATQVNAALGLLKKTLPDTKQIEIDGQIDTRTTVIIKDLTGDNNRDTPKTPR